MAGWSFFLNGTEVEEPIGWDAIEFTALRMESHGIDQPFTTELKFYDKGATLIKAQYDQFFINAQIAIQITSDVNYYGEPWEFNGFLNLAIYEEHNVCDTDTWEITVGIIDDNFREEFKARQDVEVDLNTLRDLNNNAIDELTYKQIRMHKQELYLSASAQQLIPQAIATLTWEFDCITSPFGWDITKYSSLMPAYYANTDFKEPVGSTFDPLGLMWSYGSPTFVNNAGYTRTININLKAETIFLFNNIGQGLKTFASYCSPPYVPLPLISATSNADLVVTIYDASDNLVTYTLVGSTALVSSPGSSPAHSNSTFNSWDYSGNFTVQPGHKLFVSMEIGTAGEIKKSTFIDSPVPIIDQWYDAEWKVDWRNCCLVISETNEGQYASFCNGLTIEQYFRRLIYILTGDDDKLLSDVFSEAEGGCYWNNFLTNGLKIRNARTINQIQNGCVPPEDETTEDTKVKTSFKKIFDDLDKIFCLGWAFEWTGTEWKIRIEPREYFYQNSISQTFENVGEVTQMAKVDKLVNNIVLGYNPLWKNIQVSGSWAIHTDRNYFVANRSMNEGSTAKLDIRTDIIAEGYAIEFSRRLSSIVDGGGSSDRPNDYNLFIIWLNRQSIELAEVQNTAFNLPGESGAVTFLPGTVSMPSNLIFYSNSPLNNLYNIYHTPARIACRWWKVLGMHTYGLVNPRLQFQVGEYQTTYQSSIASYNEPCIQIPSEVTIAENTDIYADIIVPEAAEYLFKPIAVEFTFPQSLCDFLTLSQDEQYRKVRLTSGSFDIQGFITQASNQPEDPSGGTTKFTLMVAKQLANTGSAFDSGFDDGYQIGD
jgi:hypothetical protein